jgi:MFS family permease
MLTLGVNGTAIMAALPTIRHDLGLGARQLEWAINVYLVVSAACIIPGGKTCDRVGARRVAIGGLVLFAIASMIVAMTNAPAGLMAGRALQGLAAALAVPATLAAVTEASPPDRRASAIGAWAGFLMLGFSLGPLIGGALTHYMSWRVIFWASGLTMLAAACGFLVAGASAAAVEERRVARFDWIGFALLAIAMMALVSALHALPEVARVPAACFSLVLLATVAFVALLKVEGRTRDPLIDLTIFGAPGFVRAVALGSIAMSSIPAFLLFYNLHAQSPSGLSLTAVGTGVSLLPLSGGLLIFAFAAPHLVRRFGPRHVLAAGNLLTAAAGAAIAVAATVPMWVPLAIGLFAFGAGLALPYATAPRLALSALPAAHAGGGSGIINACTFLGGSIGVAAGAVAFATDGLRAVMGLIVALALVGAWLSASLPARG